MRRGPSSDPAPYERLAPVADAFGAPVLRDQDRIGRPGTARPILGGDPVLTICAVALSKRVRAGQRDPSDRQ
jgi:hypothetical protein